MACPLCGEQCRCSAAPADDAHVSVLIDPESYDDSEQKFASTIDAGAGAHSLTHDVLADLEGSAENDALGSTGTPVVTPRLGAMAGAPPVVAAVTTTLIEAATTEPPPRLYRPPEPPVWRGQVT